MQLLDIPKQLWVTLGVEALLLILTLMLLSEPGILIRDRGPRWRKAFRAGGLVFLCITFFWSFILGHLIAIFHITRRAGFGE